MKVCELIDILKTFDSSLEIAIYEEGLYVSPTEVKMLEMKPHSFYSEELHKRNTCSVNVVVISDSV